MDVSTRIVQLRERTGLSRRQLARIVGIPTIRLARLEQGQQASVLLVHQIDRVEQALRPHYRPDPTETRRAIHTRPTEGPSVVAQLLAERHDQLPTDEPRSWAARQPAR